MFQTRHGISGAIAAALAGAVIPSRTKLSAAQALTTGAAFGYSGFTTKGTYFVSRHAAGVRAAKRAKNKRKNVARHKGHLQRSKN